MKNTLAYNDRACLYIYMGRYEEAVVDSKKVIELSPTEANSYGHLGYALFKLGKIEEALHWMDQSIKINSSYARVYCYRAILYISIKNYEAAKEDYNKCMELIPKEISDIYYVGAILDAINNNFKDAYDKVTTCLNFIYQTRIISFNEIFQFQLDIKKKL